MQFTRLDIPDVILLEPGVHGDARGWFYESHNRRTFAAGTGVDVEFVQDNHSLSTRNVLRGLAYQLQRPQGRLARVLRGAVYEVAVDLRRGSPHFGRWVGAELSAQNRRMLWVPPGFAAGFLTLSDEAEYFYKATEYYAPELKRSLLWNDPEVGIEWPLHDAQPLVSARDAAGRLLREAETYP